MYLFARLPFSLLALCAITSIPASAGIERSIEKTFTVEPGSVVKVDVSGASIRTSVGPAGTAHIVLKEKFRTDDASEADRQLERYEVVCEQNGAEVKLVVRAKRGTGLGWIGGRGVSFSPEITVPADVRLDLDTSGGSITVVGHMNAPVRADTSGGSIRVDGGASLALDTSGGSINVGRVIGSLSADTSGGSITVDYVGPDATDVNLDTSGGSIRVGVDPTAKLDIVADTSGGRVRVEGFANFVAKKKERTHIAGSLNGGGGRLRADTSGGSITIDAVAK